MDKKSLGRKEELMAIISGKGKDAEVEARQLIDEIIFIENQLTELKKLPFISVNPKNPAIQKATPASRQYKDLLQQYTNALKLLLKLAGDLGEVDEESPLRKWLKNRKEFEKCLRVLAKVTKPRV